MRNEQRHDKLRFQDIVIINNGESYADVVAVPEL